MAEQRDNPAATFRGKMAAMRALEQLGDLDGLPILRRVQEREVDGRIVRLARTVANGLRQGATRPQEMVTLRGDVDSVVKENKALRDRLDAIEQKTSPQEATRGDEKAAPAAAKPAAPAKPATARAASRPTPPKRSDAARPRTRMARPKARSRSRR